MRDTVKTNNVAQFVEAKIKEFAAMYFYAGGSRNGKMLDFKAWEQEKRCLECRGWGNLCRDGCGGSHCFLVVR